MKYLFGHTSEETAYVVEDYPWGFRLRTQQRHWVETKPGFGQRHVTQTLNPKTDKWCKPKKATYADIALMGVDEETGRLKFGGWGIAYTGEKELKAFLEEVGEENLTEFQQNQIKRGRAVIETRKHITYTMTSTTHVPIPLSEINKPGFKQIAEAEIERQEAHKKQQAEVQKKIGKLYAYHAKETGYDESKNRRGAQS